MAGLYLHIPFCRKACHYCNFHFSTDLSYVERMVNAICDEIELTADYLQVDTLETIYFGGGTPSVLSPNQLNQILSKVHNHYTITNNVEVTFEANPEDLTLEYCKELKSVGINRLSVGLQSFIADDLSFMNRSHDLNQARTALRHVRLANIDQLCTDLMFGLINSNMNQWQNNLSELVKYEPDHISCYNLTIEEQTAFHKWNRQGKIKILEETLQFDQFIQAHEFLTGQGYDHYEISNFSLPGCRSRHNSAYWDHAKYLGVGPGAHSFDGTTRSWNPSNNQKYLRSIEEGTLTKEEEVLSDQNLYNETIMLCLRQAKGIKVSEVSTTFDNRIMQHFKLQADKLIMQGLLIDDDTHYRLGIDNWYLADHISEQLFYT